MSSIWNLDPITENSYCNRSNLSAIGKKTHKFQHEIWTFWHSFSCLLWKADAISFISSALLLTFLLFRFCFITPDIFYWIQIWWSWRLFNTLYLIFSVRFFFFWTNMITSIISYKHNLFISYFLVVWYCFPKDSNKC